MSKIVPQEFKAKTTIDQQPKRLTPRIHNIILLDIAGKGTNDISAAIGLSASRISIIKSAPFYKSRLEAERILLRDKVLEKHSDNIVGDPVETKLKGLALAAVEQYEDLLKDGLSEHIRKGVADQILDRTGHKAQVEKTKISVEVTSKMADRFERALIHNESPENAGVAKVRITQEMSS